MIKVRFICSCGAHLDTWDCHRVGGAPYGNYCEDGKMAVGLFDHFRPTVSVTYKAIRPTTGKMVSVKIEEVREELHAMHRVAIDWQRRSREAHAAGVTAERARIIALLIAEQNNWDEGTRVHTEFGDMAKRIVRSAEKST